MNAVVRRVARSCSLALLLAASTAVANTPAELHEKYLSIVRGGSVTEARLREAKDYESQAFALSPQFKYAYNVGIAHATLEEYRESTDWLEKAEALAAEPAQRERTRSALNLARTELAKLETEDWGTSFSIRMVLKGGSLEMDRDNLDLLPSKLAQHEAGKPLSDLVEPIRSILEASDYAMVEKPPFLIVSSEQGLSGEEHYRRGVESFYRWYKLRYFENDIPRPLVVLMVDDPYSGQELIRAIYPSMTGLAYQPFLGIYNPKDNLIVATVPAGYGTFLHELMHAMVRMDFPDVPAWLDESMAMLYERSMWRSDALVPLPNWRLDGIRDPSVLDLDRFASMGSRDRLGYDDLSALRMLMLYLESQGQLKAFYQSVKNDPSLRDPGAAVASLTIAPDNWRVFVSNTYTQYRADMNRGGNGLSNPDEIRFVQHALNQILGTNLDVDGHWGPSTELQVEAFQEKYGLEVDGKVGPNTMKQLKLALAGLGDG